MLYYARLGDGRILIIGADNESQAHEHCRELAQGVSDWELRSLGPEFRGVIVFNPHRDDDQ